MKYKRKSVINSRKRKMVKKKIRNSTVGQKFGKICDNSNKKILRKKAGNVTVPSKKDTVRKKTNAQSLLTNDDVQFNNALCIDKLRQSLSVTIKSAAQEKQNSINDCQKKSENSSENDKTQLTPNKDVFDKEKLKSLLKVVSDNVGPISNSPRDQKRGKLDDNNQKLTITNVAKQSCEKVNAVEEGKYKRKRSRGSRRANSDPDPKKKKRTSETGQEDEANSGVDVNKLKKVVLSKLSQSGNVGTASNNEIEGSTKLSKAAKKLLPLRERMVERLNAARFRYINEHLYSTTGFDAKAYFTKEGDAFDVYHQGYQNQVLKWPVNPIDVIIKSVLEKSRSLEIADFGCGDAKLARSVPNNVHSFDLKALNEHVVECDISKVPLNKESVDIVVCCLSLMGTNLADYLKEANRILKMGGELKVAEIESRIVNIKAFLRALKALGFNLVQQDNSHKMFVFLDLVKKKTCPPNKIVNIELQPCLYKKR